MGKVNPTIYLSHCDLASIVFQQLLSKIGNTSKKCFTSSDPQPVISRFHLAEWFNISERCSRELTEEEARTMIKLSVLSQHYAIQTSFFGWDGPVICCLGCVDSRVFGTG